MYFGNVLAPPSQGVPVLGFPSHRWSVGVLGDWEEVVSCTPADMVTSLVVMVMSWGLVVQAGGWQRCRQVNTEFTVCSRQ